MKADFGSTRQAKIKFLSTRLEEIRHEVQRLMAEETQRLRELDDLGAAISILPSEVLAIMFKYACLETNAFPLVIGGVCSRWRNIAWSTPRLWTSLFISIAMDEEDLDNSILPSRCYDILHLYFTNLQALPLSLELRDMGEGWGAPMSAWKGPFIPYRKFFNLIFRVNPHKLRSFRFHEFSSEWWGIFGRSFKPHRLTKFESIDFEWYAWDRPIDADIPFTIPSLTKASFSNRDRACNGSFPLLQLPWGQLTSLTLWGLPMKECLDLLVNTCQSLKEFRCIKPASSSSSFPLSNYSNTTLLNLETLDWWFSEDNGTRFLISSMHFPSLRNLHCQNLSSLPPDLSQPMNGFVQNMPYLTTFGSDCITLSPEDQPSNNGEDDSEDQTSSSGEGGSRDQAGSGEEEDLEDQTSGGGEDYSDYDQYQYLDGLFTRSGLRELYLNECDPQEFRFLFAKLTLQGQADTGEPVFPQLQVLQLGYSDYIFKPTVFPAFVEMLRSRWDGGNGGYVRLGCVRLYGVDSLEEGYEGNEPSMNKLQKLMDEGLEVFLVPYDLGR